MPWSKKRIPLSNIVGSSHRSGIAMTDRETAMILAAEDIRHLISGTCYREDTRVQESYGSQAIITGWKIRIGTC
jgi:hypothetical protein